MSDNDEQSTLTTTPHPDIIGEITTLINEKEGKELLEQFDRLVCSMERIESLMMTAGSSQTSFGETAAQLGRHVPRIAAALEATANQLARVADSAETLIEHSKALTENTTSLIEMAREATGLTSNNRRYLRTADIGRMAGTAPAPQTKSGR